MVTKLDIDITKKKYIQLICKMPILCNFSQDEIKTLMSNPKTIRVFNYLAGENIILENTFDAWTYWLISGSVVVTKNQNWLACLSQTGDIFGEMAPINGLPRCATIAAEVDTVCLGLDVSAFDCLAKEQQNYFWKTFCMGFTEVALKRLETSNQRIIKLEQEAKEIKKKKKKHNLNFSFSKH